MKKKLVKLTQSGFFCEIDAIELARTSQKLKSYLLQSRPAVVDMPDLVDVVLPLCEAALNGTLALPVERGMPYGHPEVEALLPEEFLRFWRPFVIAATGISARLSEPQVIDGERYCERIFEEPGDWPDEVARWEAEQWAMRQAGRGRN